MQTIKHTELSEMAKELSESFAERGIAIDNALSAQLNMLLLDFVVSNQLAVVEHAHVYFPDSSEIPDSIDYFIGNYVQNLHNLSNTKIAAPWAIALEGILNSAGFGVNFDDDFLIKDIYTSSDIATHTYNPADIDLFEHPYFLPDNIRHEIDQFCKELQAGGSFYEKCSTLLEKLRPLGFTFNYGESGQPTGLIRTEHSFPHLFSGVIDDYISREQCDNDKAVSDHHALDFAQFAEGNPDIDKVGYSVSIVSIRNAEDVESLNKNITDEPKNFTWKDAKYLAKKGVFSHAFIKVGEIYFDAECVDGVSNPLDLPVFERALAAYNQQYQSPSMG
jgi:hypothetical protein